MVPDFLTDRSMKEIEFNDIKSDLGSEYDDGFVKGAVVTPD
mgnify:CR=1 FL=1